MAKWASLQAAEKFLKAYIVQQGTKPGRIHVLRNLADVAESLGLRPIPRTVVALAECSPSARYEAASVSRAEAVDGYRAAVEIAGGIALQLNGTSLWRTEIHGDGVLTVGGLEERIPMIAMHRFAIKSPLDRV